MSILADLVVYFARRLPRGYWSLLKIASRIDPSLRQYPIALKEIPGVFLTSDLRESVFIPILRHGRIPHQSGLDSLLKQVVQRGDFCIDIGANIGYTACLLSHLVGADGKLVAFEPSKRIFHFLKRNLERFPHATPLNLAVAEASTELGFVDSPFSDLSHLAGVPEQSSYKVKCVSIDDYLDELGKGFNAPSLIKIDVEGFEPSVLLGASKLMSSDDPPILVFEALNNDALGKCQSILNSYKDTGARLYRIANDGIRRDLSDESCSNDFVYVPSKRVDLFSENVRSLN